MGIFGTSSPFDQDVERATSETNTSEEWGLMMEICDRAGGGAAAARDCLRAVLRRLAHHDPHVQLLAATLLDACVSNCGRAFLLEVASRDFEAEFRRVLARAQPPVQRRLKALLRKWAEGEFRDDPQLDLIPALYAKVRDETPGPVPAPSERAIAAAQKEMDDLARAIALSLRETQGGAPAPAAAPAPATAAPAAPLYPRVEERRPEERRAEERRVRALYDFEAAEDNELTFAAGELLTVTDASDANWWKGYTERGEGLFPANFVTSDLSEPPPMHAPAGGSPSEPTNSAAVGTAGMAEEGGDEIDEAAMDAALAALHEADPGAAATSDPPALRRLEARVAAMGAAVDARLERADTRHARLTQLSADLVDALNLYHELMRAAPPPPPLYHAAPPHAPPHAPPQPH